MNNFKMFKPNLKLNNLTRIVQFDRFLASGNLFDEEVIKKRIALKERSIKSTDRLNNHLNNLKIKSINKSTSNSSFNLDQITDESRTVLNLISSYLNDWSTKDQLLDPEFKKIRNNQIEFIYDKIKRLYFESKESENEFIELLKSSTEFQKLLDHTGRLANELSTNCLIDLLRIVTLILNKDPRNVIVRNTIQILKSKFDCLKHHEMLSCLEIINQYQVNPYENNYLMQSNQDYLLNFYYALLQLVKQEIRKNKLDANDFELIIRHFSFFLNSDGSDLDFEMVNFLTELLLSNKIDLNFKKSVLILRIIKLNHLSYKENTYFGKKENDLLPLSRLVDKCNSIVYKTLSSENSDLSLDLNYYLVNIHDFVNPLFDFDRFYDPQILDLLAPYLIDKLRSGENYVNFIFNLVSNYSKQHVYHEVLLKFFYDLWSKDVKLVPKVAVVNYYYLFSKYRLPFVDITLLANKFLLNTSGYYNNNNKNTTDFNKKNTFKILCELILYDVTDERLLIYFDKSTDKVDREFFRERTNRLYKELALSKVYLIMFSKLNANIKSKLLTKIEKSLNTISDLNRKPMIRFKFLRFNSKIQSGAFLSNGIHLDKIVIYDKALRNLIPLTEFKDHFDKIDKIPLNKDQEL